MMILHNKCKANNEIAKANIPNFFLSKKSCNFFQKIAVQFSKPFSLIFLFSIFIDYPPTWPVTQVYAISIITILILLAIKFQIRATLIIALTLPTIKFQARTTLIVSSTLPIIIFQAYTVFVIDLNPIFAMTLPVELTYALLKEF